MALNPLEGPYGPMTWNQIVALGVTMTAAHAGTRCYCSDFSNAEFVWDGAFWGSPSPGKMTFAQMQGLGNVSDGTLVAIREFHWATFTYSEGRWVSTFPLPLFSASVPFVYPSSGSFANNGALTLNTALPQAYPYCFMYFPAGTIFSGSAAGWYLAQGSTTSTFTVYNNPYPNPQYNVTGDPDESVPIAAGGKFGVFVPFVCMGPGAYAQTTGADITAIDYALPANLILAFGAIDYTMISTRPANANSHSMKILIGGNSIGLESASGLNSLYMQRRICNLAGQKTQVSPPTTLYGPGSSSSVPALYTAIDFTVAQALSCTINLGNAADYYVIDTFQAVVIFS